MSKEGKKCKTFLKLLMVIESKGLNFDHYIKFKGLTNDKLIELKRECKNKIYEYQHAIYVCNMIMRDRLPKLKQDIEEARENKDEIH